MTNKKGTAPKRNAAPVDNSIISQLGNIAKKRQIKYDFTPIVAPIIYPGLTLIAGKPKTGKSRIMLSFAMQAAMLEKKIIYISEDKPDTTAARLNAFSDTEIQAAEKNLYIINYIDLIQNYNKNVYKFIQKNIHSIDILMIDTLSMIQNDIVLDTNNYTAMMQFMAKLNIIMVENNIKAMIVIHHLGKTDNNDIFSQILGSTALRAGVDNTFTMQLLQNNNTNSIIRVDMESRNVIPKQPFAIFLNGEKIEKFEPIKNIELQGLKKKIYDAIQMKNAEDEKATPASIYNLLHADDNKITQANVRKVIQLLKNQGLIEKEDGSYHIVIQTVKE